VRLKQPVEYVAQEVYSEFKRHFKVRFSDIKEAIQIAFDRFDGFKKRLFEIGREILSKHDPDEPIIVVTGRLYNLYDERLNLKLGQNLSKIGLKAIPMDFLDVSSVDLSDFPSMYWGLGSQILRTAKFIRSTPVMFGIHLTNFGCGPDSFLEHFYKHVMGDKPYLILELDEHSAVAGMMTRLEAFKNVVENSMRVGASEPQKRYMVS
jgi:predicted nucleotide-binding protein (sugar kinase/HSP70/actin superfamily)